MVQMMLLQGAAWACAGLYHSEETLAESDAQEVILSETADGIRAAYRVEYDGDADDFGWLIPAFGEFVSLEEADAAEFDDLRAWSQPQVSYTYDAPEGEDGGGGCRGGAKSGGTDRANSFDTASAGGQSDGGVEVVAEGFTGTYAFQVLEATDSSAFQDWLTENGWSSGGTQPAIDAYIAEGGVQFVALRLTDAGGQTPDEGRELPPVAITTTGGTLRFPSTMARYGMAPRQHTIVYVQGAGRASAGGGWSETAITTLWGSTEDDPTAMFMDALWDAGGTSPGWGLVFSNRAPDGDGWVTRFEAYVGRDAHTRDATSTLTAGVETSAVHILLEAGAASASWVWLAPLAMLGVGGLRRRQRLT